MTKFTGMFATIMATSLLAGCQSFPLSKLGLGKARPTTHMPTVVDESGALALAEGQEKLRQGNISGAVASLRIATLDPAVRADANNGLGIAYAKLGRTDLADRYFRMAAILEPANTKYVANLARLQRSEYFARQTPQDAVLPAVSATTPPAAPTTFAAAFETPVTEHVSITKKPTVRLTRISRGEVRISGGTPALAATRMRVEYRKAKVVALGEPGPSEQEENVEPDYPLRIALASKSKTIRPAYPVRIDMTK